MFNPGWILIFHFYQVELTKFCSKKQDEYSLQYTARKNNPPLHLDMLFTREDTKLNTE